MGFLTCIFLVFCCVSFLSTHFGAAGGIQTRGPLDPKIRLKNQGELSAPFGAVCSIRKCFPSLSAPMPPSVPSTIWVAVRVNPQSQASERSAENHWHYPLCARWRHISSRYSTLFPDPQLFHTRHLVRGSRAGTPPAVLLQPGAVLPPAL